MEKKKLPILLGILIVAIIMVVGVTYALWQITLQQETTNVITTGCFKVEFTDNNPINLEKSYPIHDEEGSSLTPYEFTITNTCDSKASFQINLEVLEDSTLTDLDYIKMMLNESNKSGISKLLRLNDTVSTTIDNASSSYKLETGVLEGSEEKTYHLRLWLDEDTPTDDAYMNKTFESKITVITSLGQTNNNTKNMMKMRYTSSDDADWWNGDARIVTYTYDLVDNYEDIFDSKKVVFQSVVNPIEGVEPVDISYNNDRSVLAYKTTDEESETVTYIQANGMIKFPEISAFLFRGVANITLEGLENVNTSYVTNMNGMFSFSNLSTLDVSHLDTTNVTNMSGMFLGMSYLDNLDLSNLDTSNVTNMTFMFYDTCKLSNLNLSNFDTSSVTDMGFMFAVRDEDSGGCGSWQHLTSLDISSFDTRNVTNMAGLFELRDMLNTITYGDSFIRKSGSNINFMFDNCLANHPTHESWNGAF